jgi:hypothetical protein
MINFSAKGVIVTAEVETGLDTTANAWLFTLNLSDELVAKSVAFQLNEELKRRVKDTRKKEYYDGYDRGKKKWACKDWFRPGLEK